MASLPALRLTAGTRWLVSAGGSLAERAIRGGIWLVLGDVLARAAALLKLVVLGRLLAPGDFGLMAIATAALKALEYLTETGFNAALIQRGGDVRPFLGTVWVAQVARALALAGALAAGAPLAGWFFDAPEAVPIVRATALVLLLRGLQNPAVVTLRKELDFRRLVVWRSSGMLAGLVVGVAVALAMGNVWALVASIIAAQAAETASSYWIVRYWPRPRFDRRQAAELIAFGKWVFWANALAFVGLYADTLALGKLLGPVALGFYQMAYGLGMMPTTTIGTHVRGVTFPAFAQIRDLAGARRAFLSTLAVVAGVVAPMAGLATAFAEPIVLTVLGARWLAAVPVLQVLAWAGAGTALSAVTNSFFEARGRPDLVAKLAALQVGLWAVVFYPLVERLGITGMATAVAVGVLVTLAVKLAVAVQMAEASPAQVLRAFALPAVTSLPPVLALLAAPAGRAGLLAAALAALASAAVVLLRLRAPLGLAGGGEARIARR